MPIDNRSLFLGFQFAGFHYVWNLSEIMARMILRQLLGDTETAWAVSAEIQNRSLLDALLSGAKDKTHASIRDKIEHFVKGYEIILAYRNYYTHSLGLIKNGEAQLLSISSKGRLKMASETLSLEDLNAMANHASKLAGYAAVILSELGYEQPGLRTILDSPLASPDKPEWPSPLQKNLRYLQEP